MKFTTTTATLLSLLTTISAAPFPGAPTKVITPTTLSIYHGFGGRIEYDTNYGLVQRKQGGNDDISTLVTFTFPADSKDKKCTFRFELDDATSSLDPVNPFVDIFSSLQPVVKSSAGWGPPNNGRDQQLGRLRVVKGGQATVEWGNFVFDCPSGQTKGYEVVTTGDRIDLRFNKGADGPYIVYA